MSKCFIVTTLVQAKLGKIISNAMKARKVIRRIRIYLMEKKTIVNFVRIELSLRQRWQIRFRKKKK